MGAVTGAIDAVKAAGAEGAGGGGGAGEGSADATAEVGLGRILPKSCWAMLVRAVLDCVISSSLLSIPSFSVILSQSSMIDEGAVL